MQYLLLIYDNEKQFETMPKDELGAFMGAYNAFSADVGCTVNLAHHRRNLVGFLSQRIKIISKELDR